MKLSEAEKKYTWKQWLNVAWIAVRHPIVFMNYLSKRSIPNKSPEEQREHFNKNYVQPLERSLKAENAEEIKKAWRK